MRARGGVRKRMGKERERVTILPSRVEIPMLQVGEGEARESQLRDREKGCREETRTRGLLV